jgi:polyribonucleotide nucleotidyltransferase
MDDLYNLEVLSLVAKITQEIDNHTGIHDKTLAEFVINLHEQSKDLDEFKQKLREIGADFPDSFSENTNRLILSMHPKYKKKSADAAFSKEDEVAEREKTRRLYPGLSLPNQDPPAKDAIMKQLISSGAMDASEYPELDEDVYNPMAHVEVEEDIDIEVREDEPSFLKGQTKRTLDLSPIRIIKAPDGSLNRAALAGVSLSKERRKLRQQEANDEAEIITYGELSNLSIQDQRRNLPIYKFREPLLKAIAEVYTPDFLRIPCTYDA